MATLLRTRLAAADAELLRYGGVPQNLATPLAYFDRVVTPTAVFFVRSDFGPPALDRARKTTFDGLVKTPLTLGVDELRASFPEVTVTAVLRAQAMGGRSTSRLYQECNGVTAPWVRLRSRACG